MKLRRNKSKWEVVDDYEKKIYGTFKTKKEALAFQELEQAFSSWANGWNRLTERQQTIIKEHYHKIGREVRGQTYDPSASANY